MTPSIFDLLDAAAVALIVVIAAAAITLWRSNQPRLFAGKVAPARESVANRQIAPPSNLPFPKYRAGRTIVIDTETTGLSPTTGHRIVAYAAIELVDGVVSGKQQSFVFNPERPCDPGARRVHGLSDAYLGRQEKFDARLQEIVDFIGRDPIVAHNAKFDLSFLLAEFRRCGVDIGKLRSQCTMEMFHSIFPAHRKSLDACCERLGINIAPRSGGHAAFVDATLCLAVFQILTSPAWPNASYTPVEPITPMNEIGRARHTKHPATVSEMLSAASERRTALSGE